MDIKDLKKNLIDLIIKYIPNRHDLELIVNSWQSIDGINLKYIVSEIDSNKIRPYDDEDLIIIKKLASDFV